MRTWELWLQSQNKENPVSINLIEIPWPYYIGMRLYWVVYEILHKIALPAFITNRLGYYDEDEPTRLIQFKDWYGDCLGCYWYVPMDKIHGYLWQKRKNTCVNAPFDDRWKDCHESKWIGEELNKDERDSI